MVKLYRLDGLVTNGGFTQGGGVPGAGGGGGGASPLVVFTDNEGANTSGSEWTHSLDFAEAGTYVIALLGQFWPNVATARVVSTSDGGAVSYIGSFDNTGAIESISFNVVEIQTPGTVTINCALLSGSFVYQSVVAAWKLDGDAEKNPSRMSVEGHIGTTEFNVSVDEGDSLIAAVLNIDGTTTLTGLSREDVGDTEIYAGSGYYYSLHSEEGVAAGTKALQVTADTNPTRVCIGVLRIPLALPAVIAAEEFNTYLITGMTSGPEIAAQEFSTYVIEQ